LVEQKQKFVTGMGGSRCDLEPPADRHVSASGSQEEGRSGRQAVGMGARGGGLLLPFLVQKLLLDGEVLRRGVAELDDGVRQQVC
jgi:hypothetical protein